MTSTDKSSAVDVGSNKYYLTEHKTYLSHFLLLSMLTEHFALARTQFVQARMCELEAASLPGLSSESWSNILPVFKAVVIIWFDERRTGPTSITLSNTDRSLSQTPKIRKSREGQRTDNINRLILIIGQYNRRTEQFVVRKMGSSRTHRIVGARKKCRIGVGA